MDHRNPEGRRNMERIFGDLDAMAGSPHDLLHLLQQNADAPRKPRLYIACGEDDFLYHQHKKFVPLAQQLGWNVTRYDEPGIGHSWAFWDKRIEFFIPWMLNEKA